VGGSPRVDSTVVGGAGVVAPDEVEGVPDELSRIAKPPAANISPPTTAPTLTTT
jgi:hypothetical protein